MEKSKKTRKCFNVYEDEAIKYGTEEALVLYNIRFWLERNKFKNHNIIDGYVWTYDSMETYCQHFPQFSVKQMRRILKNLKNDGAIITGDYSKNRFARKTWYTMPEFAVGDIKPESFDTEYEHAHTVDTKEEAPLSPNGNHEEKNAQSGCSYRPNGHLRAAQKGTSSTDKTTDITTNNIKGEQVAAEAVASDSDDKNEIEIFPFLVSSKVAKKHYQSVMEVLWYWAKVMDFRFNPNENSTANQKRARIIAERLKEYNLDLPLMKRAIDCCAASAWHMGDNPQRKRYNDIQYIFHPDKFERHLNNGTEKHRQSKRMQEICEKYGSTNDQSQEEIDITPQPRKYKQVNFNY